VPEPLDPRLDPDAAPSYRAAVDLFTALALADGPPPRAWLHCRGAALRYLDVARTSRVAPDVALRLLDEAVRRWTAPELDADGRARLLAAIPRWIGAAYGLRWRAAEPAADGTGAPGTPPPARCGAGEAPAARAMRDEALVARLRIGQARAFRAGAANAATMGRTEELRATAASLLAAIRRARSERASAPHPPNAEP
jgi:hypothetical protein